MPPADFIPLAEETGLILPLGAWLLDAVCAQLKAWERDPRYHRLVLSVNVSAKQFHEPNFVSDVLQAIDRHGIDARLIKIELTESALFDTLDNAIEKIKALQQQGLTFSLDHFGTGYSSLQYLKKLPLAQLKIDQSFVRDISFDSSDQAIVRTIIAMALALDLNVIAEGVETQEQLRFLQQHGCENFQGYLFGKPMPVDEFELRCA